MKRPGAALWLVGISAALAACGESPTPPSTPPPPTPTAQAPQPPPPAAAPAATPAPGPVTPSSAVTSADTLLTPPVPTYESKGRRDPFEPVEIAKGARGPNVASAKLTGIVRGSGSHWALVETSDGIGYILRPGDELGEGRVVEIKRDSVIFTIAQKPGTATDRIVLSLATH